MRLIDADKTIGHIKTRLLETALNNCTAVCDVSYIYQDCADNCIETWVDSMPTVDAVKVVRCKDCKWYHNANDKYFPRTCDHWSEMFSHYEDWESVDENGFCSWGERREDETD